MYFRTNFGIIFLKTLILYFEKSVIFCLTCLIKSVCYLFSVLSLKLTFSWVHSNLLRPSLWNKQRLSFFDIQSRENSSNQGRKALKNFKTYSSFDSSLGHLEKKQHKAAAPVRRLKLYDLASKASGLSKNKFYMQVSNDDQVFFQNNTLESHIL